MKVIFVSPALVIALILALNYRTHAQSALHFRSATDIVNIPGVTQLDTQFTVEAVVLLDQEQEIRQFYFEQWGGVGRPGDKQFGATSSGFKGYAYPNNMGNIWRHSRVLPLGIWHHVAYVMDQTSERFYLNGHLAASRPSTNRNVEESTTFCRLGDGWLGHISSFRISNTARYSGDSYQVPGFKMHNDSDTILLFNFTNTINNIVQDESSSNRDGVLGQGRPDATSPVLVFLPVDTDGDGVNDYREAVDGTDANDPASFNALSIGLVAHYPFNGNANDESGYNREVQTGDIAQSVSTPDDLRPGFYFGGGSNSYSLVTGIPIPTNNAYSWSMWIKPEILKPRNFLLNRIERFNENFSGTPWIEISGDGQISFSRSDYPNPQFKLFTDPSLIDTNIWTQITAVSDSSGRKQIFVNGISVAEAVDSTYGEQYPLLLIGADRYLSGHPTHAPGVNANFQGEISSVRVYDRALSPIEAAQLYINDMACMTVPNSGLTVAADFLTSFGLQRYSSGTADVTENPNAFGLFTERQFKDNRTAGRLDVITSPMTFDLYDGNSIMDLRMGGLMIQKQGSSAVVSFQPQTTTDLATQPFTNNGTAITNEIPMPGNKGFIRIQANPAPPLTSQQ